MKTVTIDQLSDYEGHDVELKGWVYNTRSIGNNRSSSTTPTRTNWNFIFSITFRLLYENNEIHTAGHVSDEARLIGFPSL